MTNDDFLTILKTHPTPGVYEHAMQMVVDVEDMDEQINKLDEVIDDLQNLVTNYNPLHKMEQ